MDASNEARVQEFLGRIAALSDGRMYPPLSDNAFTD